MTGIVGRVVQRFDVRKTGDENQRCAEQAAADGQDEALGKGESDG